MRPKRQENSVVRSFHTYNT